MTEHEEPGPFVTCPMLNKEVFRVKYMFCSYGHMLECHYPLTCDEAECDHYRREMEAEEDYDVGGEDIQGGS